MNQDLYIQLKKILKNYDFDDQANFYKLFKFAKQSGLRGLSFKEFCNYVKAMGVFSRVGRFDGLVMRSLMYNAREDQYLKTVFPQFETCPTCKGSGLVEIQLTKKKT